MATAVAGEGREERGGLGKDFSFDSGDQFLVHVHALILCYGITK